MRIADIIQKHDLDQDNEFYGDLLSYAMGASGEFSYKDGDLSYTPGGTMPSKTEAWNSLLQLKGTKVTAEDIVKFNQAYTQAQSMQTQNQIQELNKMAYRGATTEDIHGVVQNNEQMYSNLLDMITGLEGSGNEEAFNQAERLKNYLPQEDEGGFFGKLAEGDVEFMEGAGAATIAAGGYGAYKYLKSRDADEFKKATQKYKTDVRQSKGAINAENQNINRKVQQKQSILSRNPNISQRQINIMDDSIKKSQDKLTNLTKEVRPFKEYVPATKYQQLKNFASRHPMIAGAGGLLALSTLPAAGEFLGGEEGRELGRTAQNIGWLGMAGKVAMTGAKMHPAGRVASGLLYGGPALMDLYRQYQGE